MHPPCPYCGSAWVARDRGWIHGRVEGEHAWDKFCPLQGSHFFDWQMARVCGLPSTAKPLPPPPPPSCASSTPSSLSRGAIYSYTLQGGLPVFNDRGEGQPASVGFLNKCFDYLRENNPWQN